MSQRKSKEEIIGEFEAMGEYPTYYHEVEIEQMMDEYAEQEQKRLLGWLRDELFIRHNPEEVYQLFKQQVK